MSPLHSLLVASALAGEPAHEEPAYHAAPFVETAWNLEGVQESLRQALPDLLKETGRFCKVDPVLTSKKSAYATPFSVVIEESDELAASIRLTAHSFSPDYTSVLALRVPFGKQACVQDKLSSHGIVFTSRNDWDVVGRCDVFSVPSFVHKHTLFDWAHYESLAVECIFPPETISI